MVRILLSGFAASPPAPLAHAENLPPIVVKATRLENELEEAPAAASVVGRDRLQQGRPLLGFDEAFVGVPGVFALNRYNFAQDLRLSIRGFGARSSFGIRGLRVFLDGIPLTGPDGQTSLDDVDPGLLQRMEILRGPAGSLYGSSAGGVLSLYSEPAGGPPYAEGRATTGANGLRQLQAKSGGVAGDLAYLLSASHFELDGYRAQSATERNLLNAKLQREIGDKGRLDASLALLDSPTAQDPGALTPAQAEADPTQAAPLALRFDTGERVQQQRFGLGYRQQLRERSELRLRAYGFARDFDAKLPFSAVELDRLAGGGGIEYEYGHPDELHRTLIGADLEGQWDDRRRLDNDDGVIGACIADQEEHLSAVGLFLLHERRLGEQLRLDLGLRHDSVKISVDDRFLADGDDSDSANFKDFSPSAALIWSVTPGTNLYARVAGSFETPTTVELAAADGGGGLNADLEAQQAVNYELGARGKLSPAGIDLDYELALFRIDVSDQLVPFEIPSAPGRFAYENAGTSTYQGLESALSTQLTEHLQLGLAYTWSQFHFDRFTDADGDVFDGNRIPGIPRHLLGMTLDYRSGRGPYLAWETQYVGEFYADNANRQRIDPYSVTHVRAGWVLSLDDWLLEPYAGAYNLFDERYNANVRLNATGDRYLEPAPEREFYIGLSALIEF